MENKRGCLSDHFPHLIGRKVLLAPGHVGYSGIGASIVGGSNPLRTRMGTRVAHNCNEEQINSYIVADTLSVLEHTDCHARLCVGPFSHKACIANAVQPDAFVEVHCNAFSDPSARGYEIWHDGDLKSIQLAKEIAKRFMSYTPLPFRDLKDMDSEDNQGDWRNQHDALFEHMPAAERGFPLVLIECGFLTNQVDADYLTDLRNHDRIASAIVHGLDCYFANQEKEA